jgi:acetyl-CoA carboxylase biotin carboxyl carrier protein
MSEMFDLKRIKRLVVLMKENGLSELDIQQGDLRVQLKRQTVSESHLPEIRHYEPHSAVPPPVNPAAPALPSNTVEIKSPMVGTFYSASSPDTPPFVKIGDIITPEKTVCLIEAMKVYNEIQAECSGKIIAVLAENGTAVEFGQPLFRLSAD